MSLTSEGLQGALTSYFDNQGKVQKNEIDLDNDRAMLNWNLENGKQKPLDRQSHLLAGLLSIYGANPKMYGDTDWSKFGDLGPAGVTRADMTYSAAPTLKPGGASGGTSKKNALLSGLLKGAGAALASKGAAQNDASARAANAATGDGYGGQGGVFSNWNGDTQAGGFDNPDLGRGQFLQEDGSMGDSRDWSGEGTDDYDFYSQNENLFNGSQGGPQEQMQQGPNEDDMYNYDGDYGD